MLFALYAAGILSALAVSWVMKKWRRDKGEHPLLLELPSYRMPHPRDLLIGLWERAGIFLRRVGGIILALTILLWFLLSFPGAPEGATGPAIDYSFAGRIGHAMTAVFAPLGFNWQICIALIPGMAAREVAVSSLATVYALSAADDDAAAQALTPIIATPGRSPRRCRCWSGSSMRRNASRRWRRSSARPIRGSRSRSRRATCSRWRTWLRC